ncbi:hypothetical protein [Hamadaea tsunoensis]|uniref:hypothetical protein n=1 Tax=Hamadaea tsunoensis TaxID=53368 RepID=UPI000484B292|nr:hypothetical protein [Hamadaea tsunoensis]
MPDQRISDSEPVRLPRWAGPLAVEGLVLVLATVLGVLLWPDSTPHPDRVTTLVQACDLSAFGAAQVDFTIRNDDVVEHNYEVLLRVSHGTTPLGTNLSYGNFVKPAQTITVHALVPVTGDTADAVCAAKATVHDTEVGHRHS